MIGQVAAVAASAYRVISDAEIEALRAGLATGAVVSIIGGCICAVTFWAVYYLGAFLAALALTIGIMQWNHSGSVQAVRTNNCCGSPVGVWSHLYIGNILLIGCGIFGLLVCILAAVLYLQLLFWFGYVSIVGALGCILCIVGGALSVAKCNAMHRLMKQDATLNNAVSAVAAAVAAPMAQPVQVYPQAQTYGSPQQQPQAYGQPQPQYAQPPQSQYGQPQPQYGQQPQQGYGQPQVTYASPQGYAAPPPQQQDSSGLYGNSNSQYGQQPQQGYGYPPKQA